MTTTTKQWKVLNKEEIGALSPEDLHDYMEWLKMENEKKMKELEEKKIQLKEINKKKLLKDQEDVKKEDLKRIDEIRQFIIDNHA